MTPEEAAYERWYDHGPGSVAFGQRVNASMRHAREEVRKAMSSEGKQHCPSCTGWSRTADGKSTNPECPGVTCQWCEALEIRAKVEQQAREIAQLTDEKRRRVYYQDIAYDVCNILDEWRGKHPGEGVVCGTVDEPSTQVQDMLKDCLRGKETPDVTSLREALAEIKHRTWIWRMTGDTTFANIYRIAEQALALKEGKG